MRLDPYLEISRKCIHEEEELMANHFEKEDSYPLGMLY